MRGAAGIGKTALLDHARRTADASGFRVESSTGLEAETHFVCSGLHQLCAPMLDQVDALPEPQRTALRVAFGQQDGAAPDPFLVGLATLNLVSEVAEAGPLLCLVDDAHWLDQSSAQVLAFVARRIGAERLALVFAVRDGVAGDPFAGLPELRLAGLAETDARALLAGPIGAPLDDDVRDRIVAEARGNPLALLEFPRRVQPARSAGGFELPDVSSIPHRIEDGFRLRYDGLPADARLLLVVAASEPTGDAGLLWRAAAHLGIDPQAAAPAEAAGLVEIGTRVRFRHPLARSAVYRAATPPERRRAHRALAAATDPHLDPDRRAWHRAQSILGADEDAAAELERSAGRARARGGLAAAGAFLQRSAELSPKPSDRTRRALEAARTWFEAGGPDAALELLAVAEAGHPSALELARMQLLRAQIAFSLTRGSEVPGMLLDAARTLAPLDAALSRETYLEALDAAIITGGSRHHRGVREVAEGARAAPAAPVPPRPSDLLLEGLVTAFTQGYEAAVPGLARAVAAFRAADGAVTGATRRWLWLACRTALALFDDELVHELGDRDVRLAREAGALGALSRALLFQSGVQVFTGDVERAGELAGEEAAVSQATGAVPLLHAQLLLATWRGEGERADELYSAIAVAASAREQGTEISMAQYAKAVLHNGQGDYAAALVAAERSRESNELTHANLSLPELIEAASRVGEQERAVAALEQFEERALASGSPWALGLAARSRALTVTGPAAEDAFREAIRLLRAGRMGSHLARAHLVYGEWLRRDGRRQDAREQLRTAHELLSKMGASAFAARAARELRATGEHARTRTAQPTEGLTAQELHIARLVSTGATSREVGAHLFLSPRTIEAHLRNIFRKLGITSRRQLRELPVLATDGSMIARVRGPAV